MSLALQILVAGLAAGGVYGLLAAGLTLVYRLTGVVHFALGELVGLAVFVTLLVAAGTGPVTQTSVGGGRFALAIAVGFVVCVAAGAGTYLLAVQPYLSRGSTIGWVAATLAVGCGDPRRAPGRASARPAYVFPDPLPFRPHRPRGLRHRRRRVASRCAGFFVLVVALALAGAASWALTRHARGPRPAGDRRGRGRARGSSGVPVERLVTRRVRAGGRDRRARRDRRRAERALLRRHRHAARPQGARRRGRGRLPLAAAGLRRRARARRRRVGDLERLDRRPRARAAVRDADPGRRRARAARAATAAAASEQAE